MRKSCIYNIHLLLFHMNSQAKQYSLLDPYLFSLLEASLLVVGAIVGAGILRIPKDIIPFGIAGLMGWFVAAAIGLLLVYIFAHMAIEHTEVGLTAYASKNFDDLKNVKESRAVAITHWLGLVMGAALVLITFAEYSYVLLGLVNYPIVAKFTFSCSMLCALYLLNVWTSKGSLHFTNALTVLKLSLFIVIIVFSLPHWSYFKFSEILLHKHNLQSFSEFFFSAEILKVFSVLPLTLIAFLGVEAVAAPLKHSKNASKIIFGGTIIGTLLAIIIFISSHISVINLLPVDSTADAPIAEAARLLFGTFGSKAVALIACLGCVGSVNALLSFATYVLANHAQESSISLLNNKYTNQFPKNVSLITVVCIFIFLICNYIFKTDVFLQQLAPCCFVYAYMMTVISYIRVNNARKLVWAIALIGVSVLLYSCAPISLVLIVLSASVLERDLFYPYVFISSCISLFVVQLIKLMVTNQVQDLIVNEKINMNFFGSILIDIYFPLSIIIRTVITVYFIKKLCKIIILRQSDIQVIPANKKILVNATM